MKTSGGKKNKWGRVVGGEDEQWKTRGGRTEQGRVVEGDNKWWEAKTSRGG